MKGICPDCGAIASLTCFAATAGDRQCMAVIAELPREVSAVVLNYIGLFRPGTGRAVTPNKAQRLLVELRELLDRRYVVTTGKVARPCPPAIWAQAMEQMLDNRERLRLPMKNHNYLRQVAWPLADAADAAGEKNSNSSRPARGRAPEIKLSEANLAYLQTRGREADDLVATERIYLSKWGRLPDDPEASDAD